MSKLPRDSKSSCKSSIPPSTCPSSSSQYNSNTTPTSTSSTNRDSSASKSNSGSAMTAKTAPPPMLHMGNTLGSEAFASASELNQQTTALIQRNHQQVLIRHHQQQHQQCGTQAACSIPRSLPLSIPTGAIGAEIDGLSSASSTSSLESLGFSVPFNFAVVWPGVYRCSFPKEEHFEYLRLLGLKTILTLVPEEYPEENVKFMKENGIQHFQIGMQGNKQPLAAIPIEKISQAVSVVLDRRNHPILIHCNKGKHRTGCVVGCLRKMQNWVTTSVVEEYRHYSVPKNRIMDEQLLQNWDGAHLADFAAQQGGWIDRHPPVSNLLN